jgi:hypothetical protein
MDTPLRAHADARDSLAPQDALPGRPSQVREGNARKPKIALNAKQL